MNELSLTAVLNGFAARKCEVESLYANSLEEWKKLEKEANFWRLTEAEEEIYKRSRQTDALMDEIWKLLDELWAEQKPSEEVVEAKNYLVGLYDKVHGIYKGFSDLLKTAWDRLVLAHALVEGPCCSDEDEG